MRASLLLLPAVASAAALPAINWAACTGDQLPFQAPDVECAKLSVPLDWNDAQSTNVSVGLTRLKARNQTQRVGSLIYSPGGPASPASPLIAAQAAGESLFPQNVTDLFDLIGFDPRGAGPISEPAITCNLNQFNKRITYLPTSEADFNETVETQTAMWAECANLTGPLLYNIDAVSIAKDIEALRVALNEGPLNFLAISYSTIIAQTYAKLYPSNFRTIAMDAVLNHNISATAQYFDEAQGFEVGLHRFAEWCNSSSVNATDCPWKGQDVLSIYNETVTNAISSPVPAPDCEGTAIGTPEGCYANVTGEEIIIATQNGLLYKNPRAGITTGWSGLAQALSLAAKGNGTLMSQAYASARLANNESTIAYNAAATQCDDYGSGLASFSDVRYRMELGTEVAPLTRALSFKWAAQVRCLGYPKGPTNPVSDMDVNNANTKPILITQSKYDPNAPYIWAELSRQAIQSNTLVLRDGDGHTSAHLDSGNGETAEVIGQYLVTGVLPQQDLIVST